MSRRPVVVAAALVLVVAAIPFALCTTFVGDDHLFLAYARHAPHPFVAFVRDQHGGEFYRPLPMMLWWLGGRAGAGAAAPFVVLAVALHVAVAAGVGLLVARVGRDRRGGVIAGAFFLVSPFTREAAYWYAASTDLLAAAAGLGMLHALLSARPALAALALAVACLSKESAVVLPVLGALVLRGADPATPAPVILRRTAVLLPVLAAYGVVRTLVLGGIGGSGDVGAPAGAKLVQLASGWIHAFSASDVIAEPLAWILGGAGTIAAAAATWRARPRPWVPWCFVAVALAPLGAAPWIVGARYFYLAAVGVAWLVAIALGRAPAPAIVGVFGLLLGIGLAQDLARHGDVASYRARVAAARRAAVAGLAEGHATFHIDGGIKDLDLAVKEDPRAAARADTLLVLGDVPASFVLVPARRSADVDFLLARPPLPPSGAYRFGQQRIVGLARRGDEPSLDEVIRRFPDIRFIRLRLGPGGHIVPRDVTQSILRPDEP